MANPKRTGYSIVDGDTIKLDRAVDGSKFVRLANVNAPEKHTQAGQQAKRELSRELRGKPITVDVVGRSYGRTVGVVRSRGRNVNNAMRRRGY